MPKNLAITTRTINEHNCPDGQETVSADAVIPSNPQAVFIQMTSSNWAAVAGLGTVTWGVQKSPDGIAPFTDWIFETLTLGAVGRSGGLPAIGVSGGQMANYVGQTARLFARPVGSAVSLGAVLTIGN